MSGPKIVQEDRLTNRFRKACSCLAAVSLAATWSSVAGAAGAPAIRISPPVPAVVPGATLKTPVLFVSAESPVSAVQFDVEYDSSALSLAAAEGDPATESGKSLYAVDLAANKKRFLIAGTNWDSIQDGTLLTLSVGVNSGAPSGDYGLIVSNVNAAGPYGNVIRAAGLSASLAVDASLPPRLQSSGIMNAANFLPGPLSPGELITLQGSGIGPLTPQVPLGSPSATSLAGSSVLFDGVAAPLFYASIDQINAVVPFGILAGSPTQLTVTSNGHAIAAAVAQSAAVAPAIFTLNASGAGAGAVLNQDSSVNSPSNPAVRGSVVSLFGTGVGLMIPLPTDGQLAGVPLARARTPVSVQIGGQDAQVVYAGAAPGLISGVAQVNAIVPSSAPSGSSVSIVFTAGAMASQNGVTIAIK